ncbi:unnamed protein product [Alternaria sp. RS040]
MDAKLYWKQHTEEIRRKATKIVNALSCLRGSNWGASFRDLRRIYEGTVLLQMIHTSSWQKVYNDITTMRTKDFDRQEQFLCFLTPLWRQGPITYIDATAEEGRARHDKEHVKEDSLRIYTDGSGIEGEIGSAALCPPTQQARSVHTGLDTESTVYAAELQGISLALQIA